MRKTWVKPDYKQRQKRYAQFHGTKLRRNKKLLPRVEKRILAVFAHLKIIFFDFDTTYLPHKLSIMCMKTLLTKFILILASVATLLGVSKRKEDRNIENDAIKLHDFEQQDIVEDYEMAAYHNQA